MDSVGTLSDRWVVEQTLAFDNVFVMAMIFSYFAIPAQYQHRVLFYGNPRRDRAARDHDRTGCGPDPSVRLDPLSLLCSFLVFTGIKMFIMADEKPDIANNPILIYMRKHMRITDKIEGEKFFIHGPDPKTGKNRAFCHAAVRCAGSDRVRRSDFRGGPRCRRSSRSRRIRSSSTRRTSSRSWGFARSTSCWPAMVHRFHYLKYALSLVLVYVGSKIFVQQFIGKIDPAISLGITVSILLGGIACRCGRRATLRRRQSRFWQSSRALTVRF